VGKATREIGRKPLKKRKRQPVNAMTHAVNHWIRVEALAIFHEGEFSAGEVADMIGEDVKVVTGHIIDLYESGCIEFAGTKMVGNIARPIYRAVMPAPRDQREASPTASSEVSDEMYRSMSAEERDDASGAMVQSMVAEIVSSYQNKKMVDDETLALIWDEAHLDAQGEREMNTHLTRSYERAKKIRARAVSRMEKSGEKGVTKIIAVLGFRRGRASRSEVAI